MFRGKDKWAITFTSLLLLITVSWIIVLGVYLTSGRGFDWVVIIAVIYLLVSFMQAFYRRKLQKE